MDEQKRYETIDMPFYKKRIAPMLPPKVLDFHTHAWCNDQWLNSAKVGAFSTTKYMSTQLQYTVEHLLADGQRMFPDREYQAVCFGQPTPAVDLQRTNAYIVETR